jgi:hypothetical protein
LKYDASTIVRDYCLDAVANLAGTSVDAAETMLPLLRAALLTHDGKHAARALIGLANVAAQVPGRSDELRAIAESYQGDSRGVVKKAARQLLKATGQPAKVK